MSHWHQDAPQEALEKREPLAVKSIGVQDVLARVSGTREVFDKVMKSNSHYGVIPGCQKPSLWQPGAELLLYTFQLAADINVQDLSTADESRFRVTTHIRHIPSGHIVATGVGEASTSEEKYAWRAAVCDEEFESTPENQRRLKYKRKRGGGGHYTVQQVRHDIAELRNTVLKMAKKRSLVDGTKTAVAASDVFDQDLEDLAGKVEIESHRAEIKEPEAKTPEQILHDQAVAFGMEIMERTGKDKSAASELLQEVSGYATVTEFTSADEIAAARKKVLAHPVFGDSE